jgi:hypothetical protein
MHRDCPSLRSDYGKARTISCRCSHGYDIWQHEMEVMPLKEVQLWIANNSRSRVGEIT